MRNAVGWLSRQASQPAPPPPKGRRPLSSLLVFHARLQHIVESFGSAAVAVKAGQLRRLPDGRLWPRDAAGDSWEVHHVIELQYGGADYWGNYLALPRLVHTQLTHIWAAFGRQHRAEIHTAQADGTQELATAQ